MTKKDYVLIAQVINGVKGMHNPTKVEIAYQLAYWLQKDNPKFDKEKFINACGL